MAKKSEPKRLTLSQLADDARRAAMSGAKAFNDFLGSLPPEEQVIVLDLLKTAAVAALA